MLFTYLNAIVIVLLFMTLNSVVLIKYRIKRLTLQYISVIFHTLCSKMVIQDNVKQNSLRRRISVLQACDSFKSMVSCVMARLLLVS